MRIKKIELKDFKRFTHLTIDGIQQEAKLVVLVGPNGSGKTSVLEAMNQYHQFTGHHNFGESRYIFKTDVMREIQITNWNNFPENSINIDFYDAPFLNRIDGISGKGHFYFRSAYRNEPNFQINSLQQQGNPIDSVRLSTLIQNDQTVSDNYQRLIANTISSFFDVSNNKKKVETLREEIIGKIRVSMERIFEDLKFSSLGNPLNNGSFYFTKGSTIDFHYQNLSAGEKSAFDLILDIVIKSNFYPDAVYCIDEPEAHMHTKLQGKVLRELYLLIPESSQLWISTHSIGMLQEAEDIEKENPGTVVFLDFEGRDFDSEEIIRPAKISKAVRNKFYELAFGDFSKLLLPKKIVFCEGAPNGNSRKDFDKTIYSLIFGDTYPDTFFISGGSCNEIEKIEQTYGEVMTKLLQNTEIIKIVDRDDLSDQEVADLSQKRIRTLTRRHIESYLLDDSIVEKLCIVKGQPEKYQDCLDEKHKAIANSVNRGNPPDDIKSASGEIYNALKKLLGLTQRGNNSDAFLRDTMAPLITPDTAIYIKLEKDIFGENTRGGILHE